MTTASDIIFQSLTDNYQLFIFLLVFAFLFSSFGRLKIFHFNRPAQAIVASVLAIGASGTVYSVHWDQMTKIIAGLVAAGVVSMVVWTVALQRGKLRHEGERNEPRKNS